MSAATAIAVHHARPPLGDLPCAPVSRAPASVVMTAPPHAARPRRLKELLPHEVAEILAHDPRLLVPVGTLEQHGPHLPLGCDTIIIEHVADELSARFGLLRAPTLEYGVNVVTERQLPGNTSLRKKTLHRSLNDLLDTWEQAGVREFILMTSHAHDAHLEALATVITTEARVRVVDVLAIRLDDLLEAQTEAMHGDEVDTSLLLHLAPELVRPDLAQDYMLAREELRRYRRGWLKVPMASAGSIGRPPLASAEKGRAIYERIIASLVDRVVEPRTSGEGLDVEV